MMVWFASCTLVSSFIYVIVAIPTLDYYLTSRQRSPNVLRLECIDDIGRIDSSARFKFYNIMDVLIRELATDRGRNYLTYDITEDFEVLIRCIIEESHSEMIRFVGKITITMQ